MDGLPAEGEAVKDAWDRLRPQAESPGKFSDVLEYELGANGDSLFAGYSICAFPDALDSGANVDIGYLPGPMI